MYLLQHGLVSFFLSSGGEGVSDLNFAVNTFVHCIDRLGEEGHGEMVVYEMNHLGTISMRSHASRHSSRVYYLDESSHYTYQTLQLFRSCVRTSCEEQRV
jgi:hypothetical protein